MNALLFITHSDISDNVINISFYDIFVKIILEFFILIIFD